MGMEKGKFDYWGLLGLLVTVLCAIVGVCDGGMMAAGMTTSMDTGLTDAEPRGKPGQDSVGIHTPGEGLSVDKANVEDPGLILSDLDRAVLSYKPYKTPLDTIARYASQRPTNSIQVKWASVDIKPFCTNLSVAHTAVTSSDVATLSVTNPEVFAETSTILVRSVNGVEADGTASKKPLMLFVKSKLDDGKLVVMAVNGPVIAGKKARYVPSLDANVELYRMGRAASEKDIQTESYTSYPTTMDNYCQSFKCQVEVSEWYKKYDKAVDWEMEDVKEHAKYEYKMEIESSFINGVKGVVFDPKKGTTYFCDGIVNFIEGEFIYDKTKAWDNARLVDFTQQVFTGNSGSDKRFLLMGSDLMADISKIDYTKVKDVTKGNEVLMGIKWHTITTNFGTLYCLHHELLDQMGMGDEGIVIDPDYLYKYVFEAEHDQPIDKKSSGESNVDASVTTEVCCLALKYPKCHTRVRASA